MPSYEVVYVYIDNDLLSKKIFFLKKNYMQYLPRL